MPRQSGIFKIEGLLDNVSFFKSADGFLLRMKGGVSANRIANDPAFARTRENGQEFGRAGRAGKLLRTSIRNLLQNASDRLMVSRLTSAMIRVLKADLTSVRGMRNVVDGNLALLNDFDFNINAKLGRTLYAPFEVSFDRLTGQASVEIPAFVPAHMIAAPVGATHFKVISAAAEVDFNTGTYVVDQKDTAILPLGVEEAAAVSLESTLTAESELPVFMVLGLEFYQSVNGEHYPLKNGAYNALAVVKVDVV